MGTVYFSDWEFDVISPDGRHVLLMQSHYGPYHIDGVPGAAGHGGLSQSAPCHPETQFPDHAGSCLAKTSSAARPGPGRAAGALRRLVQQSQPGGSQKVMPYYG